MKLKTVLLASAIGLFATGVQAQTTWDLSGGISNPPGGVLLGTSANFAAITGDVGLSITVSGLSGVGLGTPTALFEKNLGSDEIGLGLNNDPSGEHEITVGSAILVNWTNAINAGGTLFSWQFGSTTPSGLNPGESWKVLGSNSSTISSFTTVVGTGINDESLHQIVGANALFDFYLFESTAGNVLLREVDGAGGTLTPVTGVPEPSTWAMMLLGFIGLGFAFRQRRRIQGFA